MTFEQRQLARDWLRVETLELKQVAPVAVKPVPVQQIIEQQQLGVCSQSQDLMTDDCDQYRNPE